MNLQTAPLKSRNDKVIDGVCAGFAHSLSVDPFWIRLFAAVLIPITGGFAILVYIILMIVMKSEPEIEVTKKDTKKP